MTYVGARALQSLSVLDVLCQNLVMLAPPEHGA